MFKDLFRVKSHMDNGIQDPSIAHLHRVLSATDLVLLGIGAIIGAGIFVLTGIAASRSGPAVVLSYILAGLACGFSALSYAELAGSVGGCGSAYGYAYVAMGELIAWIIGWDLILEYSIAVSAVAVGWAHYAESLLNAFHIHIPAYLLHGPLEETPGLFNLPAMIVVLFIMILLSIGVKTSARFNAVMVFIKISVLLLFIGIAAQHVNMTNWHPFMPTGWSGVMSGAALIFFAYIGFDAVSTTAEEVIDPQRSLPIGIIGSLVICTIFYIVIAGLLTAVEPYNTLNTSSPVSDVLHRLGYSMAAATVSVGAIAGLTTVILVMYYGLTRVSLAISRDRLLPSFFAEVNPATKTPIRIIVSSGIVMMLLSGLLPISDLAELVNIGTLSAFVIVCAGVIVLRRTKPDMHRPFKTPWSPLIPVLGIISCLYLIISLPSTSWIRFFVWMSIGLVIYFVYGRKRSLLATAKEAHLPH